MDNYNRNSGQDPRHDNNGGGNGPGNNRNHSSLLIFLAVTLVTLLVMSFFNNLTNRSTSQEISYNEFLEWLNQGKVERVKLEANRLTITRKDDPSIQGMDLTFYTGRTDDPDLVSRLEHAGVTFSEEIPDTTTSLILNVLLSFAPLILIWILLGVVMRRMSGSGGMMGVGKSRAKMYMQKETGVTFKDVAGQDEAKESLQECVDFLENPGKYTQIGAKLPKGALLVGPPGTGKTLLAKAVAGEAHRPFFSLSGSECVEMFVGVGASRVRDLFEEARKNAPCIIFIDELDAIGKTRDSRFGGGNDEREQTLNQLLAEMDGFDPAQGILILAATNRPEVLDQALLRPGRFDRRVIVDKPDLKGRIEVLKVHSKNVKMDETVDLEGIALATSGAVGSDLANMINEAAILAVKKGRHVVSQKDLLEAVEVVLVGKEKKDRVLSAEERKIVSYHEVGHALVSALQKDSEPVQKITIVPRTMGALGYVLNVPEEEKYLNTENELRAMLVEFVAGRAAEELVFDTVTTGAANDIEKATKVARAMITQYGMSEKFGLMGLESAANQYLEGRTVLNCADATASEVDREVMELLKQAYSQAKKLLSEHRATLDRIAAFLIEKETITGKEFMEIFHQMEGTAAGQEKTSSRISMTGSAPDVTGSASNAAGPAPDVTGSASDAAGPAPDVIILPDTQQPDTQQPDAQQKDPDPRQSSDRFRPEGSVAPKEAPRSPEDMISSWEHPAAPETEDSETPAEQPKAAPETETSDEI